jgi:predicted GNAT family acetyltransferase
MHIQHDPDNHQFFTDIEEYTATLKYSVHPDQKILDYYSTFVPPQLRRRGIGEALVKFALDYAIENGYKVIPSCWFTKDFIDSHPEYQKVLA